MKRIHVLGLVLASVFAVNLAISGCTQAQATPTPAPAKPAAPTVAEAGKVAPTAAAPAKAAEPTKAAAPTAEKASFPVKGRTITLIAPYAAGGTSDIMARVLSPFIEKELGTPVVVVNKPGANSQVGVTELLKSKPDGYTLGTFLIPDIVVIYIDAERNPAFGRKDIEPLAIMARQPTLVAVKGDSPIKDLKGLVEAAKTKQLTAGTPGLLSVNHLSGKQWEKQAGVKFSYVHFDGVTGAMTALAGGHLDLVFGGASPPVVSANKSGQARVLGVMDKQPHPFMPEVKTFESQGYPLQILINYAWALPVGTPRDVVDVLGAAFKKAADSPEMKEKMANAGLSAYYGGPAEMMKLLEDTEVQAKPIVEEIKRDEKQK